MTHRTSTVAAAVLLALGTQAGAYECGANLSRLDSRVKSYEGRSGSPDLPTRAELVELRTLVDAAHILRRNGREEGCGAALEEVADRVARIDRPAVLPAERLVDSEVEDHKGEEVGTVEHVVLHRARDSVPFAVVRHGSVLGVGGSLKPVPIDALHPTADPDRFELAIEPSRLEDAPAYDEDVSDPVQVRKWLLAAHDYYGLRAPGKALENEGDSASVTRLDSTARQRAGDRARPAASAAGGAKAAVRPARPGRADDQKVAEDMERVERTLKRHEERLGSLSESQRALTDRIMALGADLARLDEQRATADRGAVDSAGEVSAASAHTGNAPAIDSSASKVTHGASTGPAASGSAADTSPPDDGPGITSKKAQIAIEAARGTDDPHSREIGEAGGGGEVEFTKADPDSNGLTSDGKTGNADMTSTGSAGTVSEPAASSPESGQGIGSENARKETEAARGTDDPRSREIGNDRPRKS